MSMNVTKGGERVITN